jgi:DNA-nicking Smr family endonuclease
MSIKHTDLSMVLPTVSGGTAGQPTTHRPAGKASRLSKSVERALMSEGKTESSATQQEQPSKTTSVPTMRLDSNTVDIRGCTLEEAKSAVRDMVSKCLMNGQSTVYVLHGHGSAGALKSKLRGWLKSERQLVKKWAPADQSNGGDAFTQLQLR